MEVTLLPIKMRVILQEKDEFCEEAKKKPKCVLSKLHVFEESLKLNLCICSEALLTGFSCNHIKLCMYQTHINSFLASCSFEVGCLLLDLGLIRFYVEENVEVCLLVQEAGYLL